MMGGPMRMLQEETRKARSVRTTLGRLGRYFRPYWIVLLSTLLLMLINVFVQVKTPQYIGEAVDCYLSPLVSAQMQLKEQPAQATEQAAAQAKSCTFGDLPENAATTKPQGTTTQFIVGLLGMGEPPAD